MSNKKTDRDFWNWLKEGIDNEWITNTFCMTHDGGLDVMSDEEQQEWENGGDPCMTVTRVIYLG